MTLPLMITKVDNLTRGLIGHSSTKKHYHFTLFFLHLHLHLHLHLLLLLKTRADFGTVQFGGKKVLPVKKAKKKSEINSPTFLKLDFDPERKYDVNKKWFKIRWFISFFFFFDRSLLCFCGCFSYRSENKENWSPPTAVVKKNLENIFMVVLRLLLRDQEISRAKFPQKGNKSHRDPRSFYPFTSLKSCRMLWNQQRKRSSRTREWLWIIQKKKPIKGISLKQTIRNLLSTFPGQNLLLKVKVSHLLVRLLCKLGEMKLEQRNAKTLKRFSVIDLIDCFLW